VWAAVLTFVGCTFTIVSAFLPWAEEARFGVSLESFGMQFGAVLLAVLAVASAGIAVILLRLPVGVWVLLILVILATSELGLSIWRAVNILHAIEQMQSRGIFIGAIGTGAYGAIIGSLATLAGGIVAWTKREDVPS
jgi:hypothetical protein